MLILRALLGIFSIILIALNTLIHALLILLFGSFVWCLQWHLPTYRIGMKGLHYLPASWAVCNLGILQLSTTGKWDIQGTGTLSRNQWYMLISNHQSWMDILVLGAVFARKIPVLMFFMKKELLWSLPVAGLAAYLLGAPFMERHTRADIRKNPALKGKDIETAKVACQKFRLVPTTVINFLEGTRITPEKHAKQASPYQRLLKPKAGGMAIVVNEMHDCLAGVLNVTVDYLGKDLSFWRMICGHTKKVVVRYELLPIPEHLLGDYYQDRAYRARFQQWLNDIWTNKDATLQALHHDT